MRFLPREMGGIKQTILITPFFTGIKKSAEALSRNLIRYTGLTARVHYNGRKHQVRILENSEEVDSKPYKIYFVDAKGFFIAPSDPYVNPGNTEQLFEDALFFCAAVPEVLRAIPEEAPYLMHLQDWETACTVETISPSIPHKCVLTLHNPYDHELAKKDLEKLKITSKTDISTTTVLRNAIPKMVGVSTVSSNFARELTTESLFRDVFTPHLQELFKRKGVIGIENGNFVDVRFPSLSNAVDILTHKYNARKKLIALLRSRTGKKMLKQGWGSADLSDVSIPLFLMFGRDDPRQKGYDVAVETVRNVLTEKGTDFARFVFTPIPGQKGIESLQYLKKLAEEFTGSVIIFPFRMQVGYAELQFSASYLLMCSLYEPFGGATEGYANGVPVIARATGGLVQQVYPKNCENLPRNIRLLVDKYHGVDKKPTGFLYREKKIPEQIIDWQGLIRAKFLDEIPPGDPIAERLDYPLFKSMVKGAAETIVLAVHLYKNNYREYAELVVNGLKMLKRFSWQRAAKKYITELYKCNNNFEVGHDERKRRQ
jgi:glycogen synthase